ncbi:MAG: T9SS type A sorting domain-containing protein, partial [Bacteroidia bacterium]
YGMSARGRLMQHHLDLWNTWNTVGGSPFGTMFVGKLDMNNIGTMGHSRGGEGVVSNALYNKSLGSPYGIKAVLTLAPVDFLREVLNDVPFMNVAPYCDGDVSDLQGVHYLDDARYSVPTDDAPKHSVLFMGCDHNFFNTVWTPGLYPAGGSDDWGYTSDPQCGSGPGNKRLTPSEQQAAFNAYASAFFRLYIGNETTFAPILEVDDLVPPVSSMLDTTAVHVTYHAPYSKRLDINKMTVVGNATTNTISGAVTTGGLVSSGICGGGLGEASCGIGGGADQEPHRGSSGTGGLSQMDLRWNSASDFYENALPAAYQNVTNYVDLQFRASENFNETSAGTDIYFTIQLIDALGNVSSQITKNHTHALFYQPGTQAGELPKILYNTIKIPLSDFTGIDLTQVQAIKFLFNKTGAGAIMISDLCLTGHPPITTSVANNLESTVLIYPNPADNNVNIDLGNSYKENTKLNLYDIQGKLVCHFENVKDELIKIDLTNFENGIYILNIVSDKVAKNYKIVKQ